MHTRRMRIPTDTGRRIWPVLGVLLAAVLVPTACVLWFMNAAMRSERLAVRQRLTDVYRSRAEALRSRLDAAVVVRVATLDEGRDLSPPARFAKLVRTGAADTVIVLGKDGQPAYPTATMFPVVPRGSSVQWRRAEELERSPSTVEAAAKAYAEIARTGAEVNIRARALQAQVRCLVRLGHKDKALSIVTGPLADAKLRDAADIHGQLVGPNAQLLALELLGKPDDPRFRSINKQLSARLADYGDAAMSSSQRRFLVHALVQLDPQAEPPATLAAETLAEDYLRKAASSAKPQRLTAVGESDLCHIASRDGSIAAIFKMKGITSALSSAVELAEPFAGAQFELATPNAPAPPHPPFLSLAAGDALPGWSLRVRLIGDDPFAAAAARQNTAYLWTGLLAVGVIVLLALVAGRYLSRQMALARLKNDFVATVTHELKTPLSSMRVLVDTLLAGRCKDETQQREYLELVARENARLSRLIDNFLSFSRMERNKKAFEFAEVDVADVVRAATDSAGGRFDQPGCSLAANVADDLPPIVGDRDALITVVLNLLDNAWKYSGPEKRVTIRAEAIDGDMRLSVADNGIGLSRRAARRVFDRFYQVDSHLSRGAEGCGLGLSIVRFIVRAHGGAVSVDSQPGKGSMFTVTLPAQQGRGAGA